MGNEVTKTAGGVQLPAAMAALASGLQRNRMERPARGGQYLRFKAGRWRFGNDTATGRHLLVNIMAMQLGYVAWENRPKEDPTPNKKLGEVMQPSYKGMPDWDTLPDVNSDVGGEWKRQVAFSGRFVDEDKEDVSYSSSSLGGCDAYDDIADKILERLNGGYLPYVYPIVELDTGSYDHPKWGETFTPEFKLVAWADENGVIESDDVDDDDDDLPPAVDEVIADPDPAPGPIEGPAVEEEGAAPPRRRRRRAAA